MIREFFRNLVTRAKKAALVIKTKFIALTHGLLLPVTLKDFPPLAISPKTVNAMKLVKLYKLTSDHSPFFSLYTFFP